MSAADATQRPSRRRGTCVVVAGPDGSGKSTIVELLVDDILPGPVHRLHHRPRVLGGSTSQGQPSTEPHRDPPYPRWLSLLKLGYLFADFLLGWMLQVRPRLRDGTHVVIERGWWDQLVDPRRYRLQVPPQLIRFLGRLLPRPDVTVVLGGDSAVIAVRKGELSVAETARQSAVWRSLPQRTLRAVQVDASEPMTDVERAVRRAVIGNRSDDRWVLLPSATAPRWYLPASPARAGVNSLQLYHPVTPLGRSAWEGARAVAALGGFRFLARDGWRPPDEVLDLLVPHLPPGGRIAMAQGRKPGRSNALIIDGRTGGILAFAKIARDTAGPETLAAEVEANRVLIPLLPEGIRAPRVYHQQEQLVLFEPMIFIPRFRPWSLPPEVAFQLGGFFRAGATSDGLGPSHGDCAPWNLVRSSDSWVLVDWSDARPDAPPFEDVLHFMVQAHALLGRPTRPELLAGLEGAGRVGEVLRCYAVGAGVGLDGVPELMLAYLRRSLAALDTTAADGRRGWAAREALLASLRQTGGDIDDQGPVASPAEPRHDH